MTDSTEALREARNFLALFVSDTEPATLVIPEGFDAADFTEAYDKASKAIAAWNRRPSVPGEADPLMTEFLYWHDEIGPLGAGAWLKNQLDERAALTPSPTDRHGENLTALLETSKRLIKHRAGFPARLEEKLARHDDEIEQLCINLTKRKWLRDDCDNANLDRQLVGALRSLSARNKELVEG